MLSKMLGVGAKFNHMLYECWFQVFHESEYIDGIVYNDMIISNQKYKGVYREKLNGI